MTVIADLLAAPRSFSRTDAGGGRIFYRQLEAIRNRLGGDFDYPAAAAAGNEVQSIATYVHASSGNIKLVFTLFGGVTFTTANIAYNGNAAAILSAINTAATSASVPNWTNGDIAVSGGDLTTAAVTLTFSGASVAGKNHGLTTIDATGLVYTGGTAVLGAVSTTTGGDGSHNEVQQILQFANTVNGGHYTITLNLAGHSPITTASILFSASTATVTTAINTAVTAASYALWTNGDIAVSGAALTAGTMIFTYQGTSVTHADHGPLTITDVDLTATVTGTSGTITTTTAGGGSRPGWALLNKLGIVTSTIPEQGSDPAGVTVGMQAGSFPYQLDDETVRAVVLEASLGDGNTAVYTTLTRALGL